jgi:hypothetical protein
LPILGIYPDNPTKARTRKPGKQPGAPGSTLYRRPPDREVVHQPSTRGGGCGASLSEAPVVGRATRQVLEIPEPRLEATDHVGSSLRIVSGSAMWLAAHQPEGPNRRHPARPSPVKWWKSEATTASSP